MAKRPKQTARPNRVLLRSALLTACAFALASCQILSSTLTDPKVHRGGSDTVPDLSQRTRVTADSVGRNDQQRRIAEAEHPRILATYGGEYPDAKLERTVAKAVGRLTIASPNPNQTYKITILDSPNINAFALPGGYLYVTRGLLALANDAAEVAAVISHEMAHVTANHGVLRRQKQAQAEIGTRVAEEVLGDAASARLAEARGKLALAQFSRNQELEADVVGIRHMGESGFDPFAAPRFLESMGRFTQLRTSTGDGTDASLDFLASHPTTPQRMELARRHARAVGAPGVGDTDRDSFLDGIDGMMFGDSAGEGFVRGTDFLHPGLGIAFSVPTGYVIDNGKDAVTATGPNGAAIRFDAINLSGTASLEDYIRSGWVAGLDASTVKPISVNGLAAANAKARAETWQFDVTVVRAGGKAYRILTAEPVGGTSLDSIAGTVRNSFRELGAAERASLKPLRIRVVTVGAGDTPQSLAARMAGTDRKLELFRILNGLTATSQLQPGTRVKIVTTG
jgi:predicted Zn-dependent protease